MQGTIGVDVGSPAPELKLRGPGGQVVTLSEFRGHKNVVLVFYPLAFSPVCSHQLPEIQRQIDAFESLDAQVLGVSIDSHHANTAFARHLGLTFPLLSDFKREASAAYGVLNVEAGISERAVFVIDKRGTIAYREVSPKPGDLDQVPSNDRMLEALKALP